MFSFFFFFLRNYACMNGDMSSKIIKKIKNLTIKNLKKFFKDELKKNSLICVIFIG